MEKDITYTSFLKRLLATIIDIFWSSGLVGIITFMALENQLIGSLLLAVLVVTLWHKIGTTPGKLILGIKVVDIETLENPSIGNSVIRYLGYIVSAVVACLGFFWIIWDKKNQGWHDKMGKTIVIDSEFPLNMKKIAWAVIVLFTIIAVFVNFNQAKTLVDNQLINELQQECDHKFNAKSCIKVAHLFSQSKHPSASFNYLSYVSKACKLDSGFAECKALNSAK